MSSRMRAVWTTRLLVSLIGLLPASAAAQEPPQSRTGRQIYEAVCIACHGPEGRGGVNLELEKLVPVPDFTDCAFANREPDRGFVAVAHGGGPARGFSPMMPAWGTAFSEAELGLAVSHLRTFCTDQRWPRGELNLPRPFVTAKAFPEDEIVIATTSQSGSVMTKFYYEKRFGPLNQFEVIVPLTTRDREGAGRSTGVGDIALEYKRTLAHNRDRGRIVSVTGEFVLPTGDEAKGLGGGVAVFEPFVTFGQVLPRDGFVQAQVGFGIPMESGHDNEFFWRATVGKTLEYPRLGRNWSPMVEFLAARPLVSGGKIEWDVLPGAQVTINRRQHVRLAAGVRLPVTDADTRKKSVIVYLLWDWYEGGFLQGW
jgi:mono/diheme cytochrome c family protein